MDCRITLNPKCLSRSTSSAFTGPCRAWRNFFSLQVCYFVMVSNNIAKFMLFCFLTLQSLLLFFVLGDMCSSIGNNLATTDYVGENIFVNLVAILGLVLLSALVGNMQVSRNCCQSRLLFIFWCAWIVKEFVKLFFPVFSLGLSFFWPAEKSMHKPWVGLINERTTWVRVHHRFVKILFEMVFLHWQTKLIGLFSLWCAKSLSY